MPKIHRYRRLKPSLNSPVIDKIKRHADAQPHPVIAHYHYALAYTVHSLAKEWHHCMSCIAEEDHLIFEMVRIAL